ncbi:hypothetical protein VdG1_00741 [Verticillium dahliae VDG1]|nr:hypothetical protein VdG1_00741 [Verticillium dahliae VDG1]
MSFTNAPVTRALVIGLVSSSVVASLFDVKHYFYILVDSHFWQYRQFWRMLSYQLCYTNSSEALFASMTLYQLRILEQVWGSRKYASFIVVSGLLTAVIPPLLLTVFLRPLTAGLFNYMPAGPTPIIFAILAQYHAIIPHIYRYRVATSSANPSGDSFTGITLSDKSYKYALALQLALFQWPGSVLGALVGWVVGHSWRSDFLPSAMTRWRVPGWLVGIRAQRRRDEFEGLRRRLEGENISATASGVQAPVEGGEGRQRTVPQEMQDQLRGFMCVGSTNPTTFATTSLDEHLDSPSPSGPLCWNPLQPAVNQPLIERPHARDNYIESDVLDEPSPLSPAQPERYQQPLGINGKTLVDGYARDMANTSGGDAPRSSPLNPGQIQSSALVDLKDPIQVHLLTETALTDSKSYEILSQEEVDGLKKQVQTLTQRIQQARTNLTIQTKYRDAAISMSKLYSTGRQDGNRRKSLLNRYSGGDSAREAEAERQASERKCEELATELWNLEKSLVEPRQRLLQHTAAILQLTHKASKKAAPRNMGPPANGIPGSPESLYAFSNGRNSMEPGDDMYFNDQGLYQSLDDGTLSRGMGSIPIEPPLKSANREQNAQAQAEIERLRGETAQRQAENERLRVEYEQAQAEIDRLRSDNSQFLSQNERLRYEVSEAQAGSEENAQARGQGDQLRHENNQLRAQTDALAQELDAWRQEDSQRLQSISSTEQRLETLNRSLRDIIVKLNPAKNGDYQAPPSGASAGSERSLQGSATLDSHFAYLERGLRTVQEDQEFKTSQSLEEAESAAATASIALARAEIRVDNLNSQLCDLMLSVDSNYPTPPDATNSELDDQFDYADRSLQALETQLSRVDQLTTNSETRKREGDQSEAVLMGLWDIIQSGFADIQQRKDQRRKMRAEQGLEPDEDDVSGDEGMDVNEPYSLSAFSTKVQWLYAQATKLKDQKSVLKRQIKQQRELNNKSDSAKDEELRSKQDEIDQIRALLESSAQEANKAQTLLSQALQDVEDANNARSANDASTAQFRQQLEERDARIAALEAESRSVQTRMADVSSTVQDAESKLNQAMEDVALLTTKLADAERLAEEKQQEAEAKSKEAKDQQEEMDKMNEMMVGLKTELTFAQAELDGAYGSRKERAAAVAAVKSTVEVEQLKTEVERLKDELASTLKELEGITAETIGAEREKLDVEGRLDDALAARASLEFEMASLRDQLEGEMRNARDKVSRLQEELDAERLKAVPGAGAGARPGAGASMLSEQFRATMKQERKKFQEDIREEQAKRRRLEEELQKLRKAVGPGKSPLSPR